MKIKIVVAFLFVSTCFIELNAQTNSFAKNVFALGYGLGTWGGSLIILGENQPDYVRANSGPLCFKYVRTLSNRTELGVNLSYAKYKIGKAPAYFQYSYDDIYSAYSILARLNIFINRTEKVDTYFGFGIGYGNGKLTDSDGNLNPSHDYTIIDLLSFMEATVGARVYFTNRFGVYGEFGASKSLLQFGLAYRF